VTDLSPIQFDWIRRYVREATAIVLEDGKEYLVSSRMTDVLREHQLDNLDDLIAGLQDSRRGALHTSVVNAMTTNETSFFRDHHPFEALREKILPDLLERRGSERRLRIWCGASSSGQEPYSLALLLAQHFPELHSWEVDFVSTDISPAMLKKCRDGTFSQMEVSRGLPAPMLIRNFTKDGLNWVVKPEIRKDLRFESLNLAEPWPRMPKIDLVLMRNVLIYFDVETKRSIFKQLERVLASDGFLFLGAAETTMGVTDAFQREKVEGASYYVHAA
jgi:chemotaxis protein methyltransferase CheR